MKLRTLLVAAAAALLIGTGTAEADVIRLGSGGVVRGEIVKETSREVVVRTLGGTTVVPRGDIESIERGESPERQYKKRLAKIDAQDPEAHYTLGLWLKSIRARTLAQREFKRTIELDSDHSFARRELGYVRQDGSWTRTGAKKASSSGASPRARKKKRAAGLTVPASAELAEALSALRSRKAEARKAGWEQVADEQAEIQRLLGVLKPNSDASGSARARLRSALTRVAPGSETLSGDALAPHVQAYVETVQRPALTEALESFSRALLRRHGRVVKKFKALIKDASNTDTRADALAKWAKTRDAALTVIFDKSIYPDANHGRSGQPTVDEYVDAVRAAWTPFDRLVQRDVSTLQKMGADAATELLNALALENARLVEVRGALSARGGADVPQPVVAPVYTVLLAYRAGQIKVALESSAQLGDWERELLRRLRDDRVRAYNQTFNGKNPLAYGTVPRSLEVEQIRITNDYRTLMGRPAVEVDPRLVQSARGHSSDMTRMGFFAHESPVVGKRSPTERMGKAGYGGGGGENISLGSTSPMATHIAWYNSSGHHRNILGPRWQCMGSGKDGKHWTQNFGSRGSLPR